MPIEKNTQMKVKNNNGEWVYLYPKTKMEQIDGLNTELSSIRNQIAELLYVSPSITTFRPENNVLVYEKGFTVSSVKFIWLYNKTITGQTFNNISLPIDTREYTYTTSFNSNITFSLNATDGKNNTTKSCSISFSNGKYYGVSSLETLTIANIKTLSKVLSESKAQNFSITSGTNDYIYYCIPSRLGTPTFSVNGFTGGFSKAQTIDFTNAYNYTESYDIWKSSNKNLGTITINIT